MALVPRISITATNTKFLIPDSLSQAGGTITAVFGSLTRTLAVGSPSANTLFFLYLSSSGLAQSTTVPSLYLTSNVGSLLIGAYYSNGLAVPTFGSFVNIQGAPESEVLDDGPIVLGASTTPPTYGSMTFFQNRTTWKRIGDSAIVTMILNKNAAGTAGNGSGTYIWEMPTNLSIDTSKAPGATGVSGVNAQPSQVLHPVGHITITGAGTTLGEGFIAVWNSTGVEAYVNDQLANSGSSQGPVGSGYYPLTQIATFVLNFIVPVSGWNSTPLKDL